METRANYVLVGSFVLALIAAAFGFVIWLARVDLEHQPQTYLVYFYGSVSGLQIGSEVQYRGVPVGRITDIGIDAENIERIRVQLELNEGTPVKSDTYATLGLQGITGVAYIQLKGGTQNGHDLVAEGKDDYPVIPSRPSGLEQVLDRAPELLERAIVISERLEQLLSEKNINGISSSIDNINSTTQILANRTKQIDQAITDGAEAVASLRKLTLDLSKDAGNLTTSAQEAFKDAKKALDAFGKVADNMQAVVSENRPALRDFSQTGLYEFTQFISEARTLITNLSRLSAQLERDPAQFLFGNQQKGFEAR
jgi:phospholipid/cholesterol/gamma-HCH transport system substrate-binding protein